MWAKRQQSIFFYAYALLIKADLVSGRLGQDLVHKLGHPEKPVLA